LKSLKRDPAERIVSNARLKSHMAAECRKIMRDNRGRRAQGQRHAVGKELALWFELLRQSVQDEVKVQFAGDGYVETGHGKSEQRAEFQISD